MKIRQSNVPKVVGETIVGLGSACCGVRLEVGRCVQLESDLFTLSAALAAPRRVAIGSSPSSVGKEP